MKSLPVNTDKAPFTFGLLLGMHNEIFQAVECVKSFRHSFEKAPIVLFGNIENDVKKVSEELSLPYFVKSHYVSRLIKFDFEAREINSDELFDIIYTHLQEMSRIIEQFKVDIIIPLHPDHFVMDNFSNFLSECDYEMQFKNPISHELIAAFQTYFGEKVSLKQYGLVSFYNRCKYLEALHFLTDSQGRLLKDLVSLNPSFVYDDILLPLVMNLKGHVVMDLGITHEIQRSNWNLCQARNSQLLHQVPENFPLYNSWIRLLLLRK